MLVYRPMRLIAIHPHMHLLGREMKVWAEMKDESIQPLIHIDDWDFHWQGFYFYRTPVTPRRQHRVAVVDGRHEDTEPDSSRRDCECAEDRPAVRIPGRVVTPDVGVKPPGFEAVNVGQHIGPVGPDEIVHREANAMPPFGNPGMPCWRARLRDHCARHGPRRIREAKRVNRNENVPLGV